MKQTVLILILGLGSCTYRKEPAPIFICATSSKLTLADVQPILQRNCSNSGCHDGSKPSIPTLITQQEIKNNSADCAFQIDRGAMPPATSLALSDFDKSKLLCWLNSGAN